MRKLLLCILFIGSSIRPNYAQQTIGFIYSDTLAQDAYTLFAPFKSKSTYLIDVCGRKVNEWVSIYTPGAATYFTEEGLMVRAGLVPNLIFNGPGLGGAIEFFDWQGNVVRTIKASTNTYAQHHDFEVLPNGNVLVLVWELKSANEAIGMGRSSLTTDINGIWPEAILEYQLFPNDSEAVVWEWHVWDHLVQQFNDTLTNYDSIFQRPERINVNHLTPMAPPMDWLHINAIEYNADLDQIMLSSLVFNEIWIIDHSTTTAQSASSEDGIYGKGGDLLYRFGNPQAYNRGSSIDQHFFGQHNPTWIPIGYPNEGKIMVFNNKGGSGGLSKVEIIDPPMDEPGFYSDPSSGYSYGPSSTTWEFEDPNFFSVNVSSAQQLPNGNVLICQGADGNLFEVDYDGNVHWKYNVPVSVTPIEQGSAPFGRMVFRAEKYLPSFIGFAGLDLIGTIPIELNPLEYECVFDIIQDTGIVDTTISDTTVTDTINDSIAGLKKANSISVLRVTNPFGSDLTIRLDKAISAKYSLYNQLGQQVLEIYSQELDIRLQTGGLPNGPYYLKVLNLKNGNAKFAKLIKTATD